MLTPPPDLPPETLRHALRASWGIEVADLAYRAVGFGSHHWAAVDPGGERFFVTVDELATKRVRRCDPLAAAFDKLSRALRAAAALRDGGVPYVVAPLPSRDGAPVLRLGDAFALAVYPHVEGESFAWGTPRGPAERAAVREMVLAVHGARDTVRALAPVEDFAIPHREELEDALREAAAPGGSTATSGPYAAAAPAGSAAAGGPYARALADLLAADTGAVRALLDRYDSLAAAARDRPMVLTHGEPHPGNTMRADDGWRLVDWDTALVAPPERDLWMLADEDPSVVDAYAAATGVEIDPAICALYRNRWTLADIAMGVHRFRQPHTGTEEDDASWAILRDIVRHVATGS